MPDAHDEPPRVEEIRDYLELLGVDIHQNEPGIDPALLGEMHVGH